MPLNDESTKLLPSDGTVNKREGTDCAVSSVSSSSKGYPVRCGVITAATVGFLLVAIVILLALVVPRGGLASVALRTPRIKRPESRTEVVLGLLKLQLEDQADQQDELVEALHEQEKKTNMLQLYVDEQNQIIRSLIQAQNNKTNVMQSRIDEQNKLIQELSDRHVCTGLTRTSDWNSAGGNNVYVDVDTSHCGFPLGSKPKYFTSLAGSNYHWDTKGATSIYSSTYNSFRVYVKNDGGYSARSYNWFIQWVAFLE